MKAKVLFTIMLLSILPCFAQKSFFGLTMGETTFTQAKEILQKQNIPFEEIDNYRIVNRNTRFLLSGYTWNMFEFYFNKDKGLFLIKFNMINIQDKDTQFRNLRELLLSKYPDYRIVSTGLTQDNLTGSWILVLEGERTKISLYKSFESSKYDQPHISLTYEYLEKLPTPPSDEL